ncbi:MAG: hypothetical protein ABFR05_03860 [Bacteroidota bacterium]
MNIKKYLIGIIGVLFLATLSCDDDDLSNPQLEDTDLTVYFYGEGDNVTGIAWQGYDVLVGESLTVKLQVSPKDQTDVKWVDDTTGEILSEGLEYTFAPTEEMSQRVNFIASRPSGYEKTVVFNFRGTLGGYNSIINSWQSVKIPQGNQTGTFTAEFDMIPSKDIMDGVVTFLDGISTGYGDNSCIVRLSSAGKIDAYNDAGYAAENELVYHAGMTYHVRMEVDAATMLYSVYVTEQGGTEVEIAKDYKFRKKVTNLDHWAMVAGNWQLDDPGIHRVLNMEITTHTQNVLPVFIPVDDITMNEGTVQEIEIKANDPLAGDLKLEGSNLPRFATLTDHGYGNGTLKLSPYSECGGCDLGLYDIKVTATNAEGSSDLDFKVEVVDPNAAFDIAADAADATIWGNGAVDPNWTQLFGGHVAAGIGGDDHVVGVVPFALPEIPAGKKVKSAVLTVNVIANNSWVAVEYDVYALAARATEEVLPTDFFLGEYDTDTNATGIQKGFIVNGAGMGEFTMDETGSDNLANFMNDQYANGATSGQFIFVRINSNRDDMPTWAHLQFDSANVVPNDDPKAFPPVLTVSFEDM